MTAETPPTTLEDAVPAIVRAPAKAPVPSLKPAMGVSKADRTAIERMILFEDEHIMIVSGSTANELGLETLIRGHKGNIYLGGRNTTVRPERIFAEEMNRRRFFRMAGVGTVGAALLAACRKADEGGGGTATGETGGRPSIEEEPGNLRVFDWGGYGDGLYYPEKERRALWQQYLDETGDTPQFTLFENDDQGFTKAVSGAVMFDVVHPCGYRYRDWVDAGLVQPFDTSLYAMKWDGEWHISYEVFRDLGLAFAAVLVLIYILVTGWFHSFIIPLTIMAAIPFSLVGILPAHGGMNAFFTATSMIGFIAGAGIVVRNSIILVDFIELRVRQGMPVDQAVIDAGAVRFRPMMLTAAAVIVVLALTVLLAYAVARSIIRPLRRLRDLVRKAPLADRALGAHQPLGNRGLGRQERVGDLGGCEPAEEPEREGDLRVRRQGGMTAGEDQPQAVVMHERLHAPFVAVVQHRRHARVFRVHCARDRGLQRGQRGELREPERLMGFVRTVVRRQVAAYIDNAVQTRKEHAELQSGLAVSDARSNPEEDLFIQQRREFMVHVLASIPGRSTPTTWTFCAANFSGVCWSPSVYAFFPS